MVKRVEHRSHEGRPRAETAQPGEETAQGDLSRVYKHLTGARLFSVVTTERTRGDRRKLKHKKLHLTTQKKTFLYWERGHAPPRAAL